MTRAIQIKFNSKFNEEKNKKLFWKQLSLDGARKNRLYSLWILLNFLFNPFSKRRIMSSRHS